MTKYHPILFSTPMVQAIIQGRKTMTRRIVKPQPDVDSEPCGIPRVMYRESDWGKWMWNTPEGESILKFCPYGQVGDILWVRESFCVLHKNHVIDRKFVYKAEMKCADSEEIRQDYIKAGYDYRWKPSIHMPKVACRVFLKITGIRIERLHDITPGDACDEGIEYWNIDGEALAGGELVADFKNYMWRDDVKYPDYHFPTYANCVASFLSLWEKINGRESLEANPWVWVISFERIEKPKHDRHE